MKPLREGQDEEKEDLVDILLKLQDGDDSNKDFFLTNDNIKATILVRILINILQILLQR